MTLRLVYGRGGSPPSPPTPPPSPPGSGRRRRRRHWLAPLLWYATSRAFFMERAKSIAEIAERMTRLSRQILGQHYEVENRQVEHVLGTVRDTPLAYGVGYPHVQKGAIGLNRQYVPILTDYDVALGRAYLVDDEDCEATKKGAISSLTTCATMLRHEAASLELAQAIWPDDFDGVVADLHQVATRLERLAMRAKLL
jgi:hypothetical protein